MSSCCWESERPPMMTCAAAHVGHLPTANRLHLWAISEEKDIIVLVRFRVVLR